MLSSCVDQPSCHLRSCGCQRQEGCSGGLSKVCPACFGQATPVESGMELLEPRGAEHRQSCLMLPDPVQDACNTIYHESSHSTSATRMAFGVGNRTVSDIYHAFCAHHV